MQTIYKPTVLAAAMAAASGVAGANPIPENISQPDNALKALTGFNHNETALMKDLGLHFGGWVDFGYTHNFDSSDNFNTPVTFNFRNDRVLLNQVNLFVERAVDTEGNAWDIGGRVDFMYGSDSPFTQAAGLEISDGGKQKWVGNTNSGNNINKLAMPQAYLEVFAPVLNGITAKFGHFYTIIGYEVVTAPDNFFYSHAYTMQYGEPFTHTGALFSMPLVDNLSVTVGAVNGWDSFTADIDDAWNFIGGLNWDNGVEGAGALSAALTATHGSIAGNNGPADDLDRSLYSIVLGYDLTDSLHLVLQHDHGWQEQLGTDNEAHWYGINSYLTYDINDMFSVGSRMEWFRDEAGIRVIGNGKSTNFYEMTVGVNFTPTHWFKVRPEVRYDWAENSKPFDEGSQDDQLTFAVDAVVALF
ncbi:porin [Methylohalobius crimeensis]|uniref:porin n=1 Tax=Methylohalobius crimeensis TaxID=244365 RepID=UPI0003B3C609|nr:porin [Methylohalobius crimeensis]